MRRTVFVLASGLLHGALAWALWPAPQQHETPRLARTSVSVSLLAAPMATAGAANRATGTVSTAPGPNAGQKPSPQKAGQPDDWLPSGKLTRLPTPLDEVDLGESGSGFSGRVELTLLVDRDGRVREVRSRAGDEAARRFASQAAARFRAVRFAPGEVDGVPVNALVKIAVVSEDLSGSAM